MGQKKKILSDSIWSVAGLVLMNVALQFAVYPFWERRAGEAALGNILYLISLMNIFAVSMGVSVNYARLKESEKETSTNTPYLFILLVASVVAATVGLAITFFGGVAFSLADRIIFCVVMCATMWRYYADVEYKLLLNYKSYFVYYLLIAVGYAIGIGLFYVTGLWTITLLCGELLGLSFVFVRGHVFRFDGRTDGQTIKNVLKIVLILLGSEMLSTLIFNADRIVLKTVIDEVAVTEYYLASLLGKTIALLTTPLTGVIIGYLSKYKGELTTKIMGIVVLVSVGMVGLATIGCTVGSYIIMPILYPNQYDVVRSYFFIANLSQVMFFVGSVITVVLLRFAKSRYQIYITVVYSVCFVSICIPFAIKSGLTGFCIGLALTCFARFAVTVFLGYLTAVRNKKSKTL